MTTSIPAERQIRRSELLATEQVVADVRGLIEAGELGPGDRLPAHREFARRIGVSRPSVRAALQLSTFSSAESRALRACEKFAPD
jgi:DNA-binding FadR family transcriptional regulator